MTLVLPRREELLRLLVERSGLPKEKIQSEIEQYNTRFDSYGNEVYQRLSTRLAHWCNYVEHNWFAQRIDLYLDRLRMGKNALAIDLGFSVPYLHAHADFADRSDIGAILIDKEESARSFYEILTAVIPTARQQGDHVVIADLESNDGQEAILAAVDAAMERQKPEQVLIAVAEVAEHLANIGALDVLLSRLTNTVKRSAGFGPTIYMTAPVCPPIPSHTHYFLSEGAASAWLSQRLEVTESHMLRPPADAPQSPYLRGCACVFGFARPVRD